MCSADTQAWVVLQPNKLVFPWVGSFCVFPAVQLNDFTHHGLPAGDLFVSAAWRIVALASRGQRRDSALKRKSI